METIHKWKMKYKLTNEEISEIINELYVGAEARMIYESKEPLDIQLYTLYSRFISSCPANSIIYFTDDIHYKPRVSKFRMDGINATHILNGFEFEVYIYE